MRADYGARAMIDLAQHAGMGLIQSASIASRQRIPESYLERLLAALRRAGLVRSVRGPSGGHELARVPAAITLGDVWDALEGVSSSGSCMDDEYACNALPNCVLQDVWRELEERSRQILHGTTLEQLADRQARRQVQATYQI